jgi:hypothetical protein
MTTMRFKMPAIIMSCLVWSLMFAVPGSASATSEWYWCHGHSAKVEFPERATMSYKGWGLDFGQLPGTANWIHFAIPTPTHLDARQMNARFIRIRFWTGSNDAFISEVHVWNAEVKIRQFTGLGWSGNWQTRELNLGSLVNFDEGLGVSIKVEAGVEMMSHRFIFSGAGARFEW